MAHDLSKSTTLFKENLFQKLEFANMSVEKNFKYTNEQWIVVFFFFFFLKAKLDSYTNGGDCIKLNDYTIIQKCLDMKLLILI